jgi:hypothetical protein
MSMRRSHAEAELAAQSNACVRCGWAVYEPASLPLFLEQDLLHTLKIQDPDQTSSRVQSGSPYSVLSFGSSSSVVYPEYRSKLVRVVHSASSYSIQLDRSIGPVLACKVFRRMLHCLDSSNINSPGQHKSRQIPSYRGTREQPVASPCDRLRQRECLVPPGQESTLRVFTLQSRIVDHYQLLGCDLQLQEQHFSRHGPFWRSALLCCFAASHLSRIDS